MAWVLIVKKIFNSDFLTNGLIFKKTKKLKKRKIHTAKLLFEIFFFIINHSQKKSWIARNKKQAAIYFYLNTQWRKLVELESDAFNITIWYNYILRINSSCIIFVTLTSHYLYCLLECVWLCIYLAHLALSTPFLFPHSVLLYLSIPPALHTPKQVTTRESQT